MSALHGISVYNQDRLNDETFVANFVARTNELDQLLDELRAIARGHDTRHSVVVGARGMGKSTMLRRVSIAVRRDDELDARFMALSFREEQYNVISLDAFWRNCGEALAEWCEQTGRTDLAGKLDRAIESADWRDAEKAEAAFLGYCSQVGKRPLLLLDNLDIILGGLKEKENWQLRAALQNKDGPVVLGGATKLLTQGGDREAPFYEFFYPHFLDPLTEAELLSCMYTLAEGRANAGAHVAQILAREPERVKTLYALTGGNPRVLALIYQVLERTETDQIFADLEALLDQVTPYYKARIEEYATPQQRAVIDAVALNWDPIGSRALARATGIEITTISSHLNRMRKDGFFEEVKSSGARASYQLSERFLNIWYLMRHGTRRTRQRLRWLTLFLARLFSVDELRSMAAEARAGAACRWNIDYREAVLAAHDLVNANVETAISRPGLKKPPVPKGGDRQEQAAWNANLKKARSYIQGGNSDEALEFLEQNVRTLQSSGKAGLEEPFIETLVLKAFAFGMKEKNKESMEIYDIIIKDFGSSNSEKIQRTVVLSMMNKALILSDIGRDRDAISAYDEIVIGYGDSCISDIQVMVATALLSKGITLGDAGHDELALAVYDEVFMRYAGVELAEVQVPVARALLNKGVVLGRLDRMLDEVSIYDELVARYEGSDTADLQEQVAKALLNKGITLGQLGQTEQELTAYDSVISSFGHSEFPELQEQAARALLSKASMVATLGKYEEVVAICDDILARYPIWDMPPVQERAATALVLRAQALGCVDSTEKEIEGYDDVLTKFGKSRIPGVRRVVAAALLGKGVTLQQIGRGAEALKTYDQVDEMYGGAEIPDVQAIVARALTLKATVLSDQGQVESALDICDSILSRYRSVDDLPMHDALASVLFHKAGMLGKLGRDEDELAVYDGLISEYKGSDVHGVQIRVATTSVLKGILLWRIGRAGDALAAYEDLVTLYGNRDIPELQERVAAALVFRGFVHEQLGQTEAEIAAYDEVVSRYSAAEPSAVQEHVAAALLWKAKTLGRLGDSDQATAIYDMVLERYRNSEASELRDKVGTALGYRGNHLLDQNGDAPGAEAAYREGIEYAPQDIFPKANLAWALLFQGKFAELASLREDIGEMDEVGLLLIDAATEIARNNFGQGAECLGTVLDQGLEEEGSAFFEDLLRLIRLAVKRGSGAELIDWFEETGHHDRYAPVYAALVAFERGERFLNDFNPEIGQTARQFFDFLRAPELKT